MDIEFLSGRDIDWATAIPSPGYCCARVYGFATVDGGAGGTALGIALAFVVGIFLTRLVGAFNAKRNAAADPPRAASLNGARIHDTTDGTTDLRRRIAELQQQARRHEQLYEASEMLYGVTRPEISLRRIVELAPIGLDVDRCSIVLATGEPGKFLVAETTDRGNALENDLRGQVLDFTGMHVQTAADSGQPVVIDGCQDDPKVLLAARLKFDIRSVAYMPLRRTDGGNLGVLILMRLAAGGFSEETVKQAKLFAGQAGSAFETARLHEQALTLRVQAERDAQTKTMLLRELRHRVKNNLAAIVGLLSAGAPELGPAEQRWLDRVVERIHAMAAAQDLLNPDSADVPLGEVIDWAAASISPIAPPGVSISLCVEDVCRPVRLSSERAVALAMVLHELCYNGITHGGLTRGRGVNGGGGALSVRAKKSDGSAVRIEVEDRPPAEPATEKPKRVRLAGDTGGLGLHIVHGLVGRELSGTFSLSPRAAHSPADAPTSTQGDDEPYKAGAIAAVEFPALFPGTDAPAEAPKECVS